MSVAPLANPLFEVGIQYPINQPGGKNEMNLKLPLPPGVILFREFKAGDSIPISFTTSGNFVQLSSNDQKLTFLQDIFVKATKNQILFSLDQKDWLPFEKIVSGSLNAKVEQSDMSDPKAIIHIFANTIGTKT